MKVLLILLLAVAGSYAAFEKLEHLDISQIPEISPETWEKLAQIFGLTLLKFALGTKVEELGDVRIPIFDPIEPNVIPLDSVHLDLLPESGIAEIIHGQINFCNLTLSGLSSILLDFDLRAFFGGLGEMPRAGVIKLKLTAGNLSIDGKQDLNITLLNSVHYTAITEKFFFRLNNPAVHLDIRIENFFGLFDLTQFDINILLGDASNNGIAFNFGYGVLGGEVMTDELWVNLSKLLTSILKLALPDLLTQLNELLTRVMAALLKDCTILQLLSNPASCIGLGGTEKGVGLDEMLNLAISEFVTISESDICPKPPGGGDDTSSTTPGSQNPGTTTPSAGVENLAKPFLLVTIVLLSLFHQF